MDKKTMIGVAALGVIGFIAYSMRQGAAQQVNSTAANTSGSASAVLSGLLSGWANPSSVIPSASTVAANGTVATPAPAPAPTSWRPSSMENNDEPPAAARAPAPAPAPVPTGFAGVQNMPARPWNGPTTPSTSNIGANRDTAESRARRAANVAAIRERMKTYGADAWVSGEA